MQKNLIDQVYKNNDLLKENILKSPILLRDAT